MYNSLYSVRFSTEDILKIINNVGSNKTHGYGEISIRMLKICCFSVCRPLQIIYKCFLNSGKFSQEWKQLMLSQYIRKMINSWWKIIVLSSCYLCVVKFLFNFLNQNNLISPAQSGFKPDHSCINQLLSINHEIYHYVDEGYEISGLFLVYWKHLIRFSYRLKYKFTTENKKQQKKTFTRHLSTWGCNAQT